MEKIKLIVPSTIYHCSQIITGFLTLRDQGWDVELEDRSKDVENPFFDLPIVLAQYRGKTLAYDLWDGYQNPEGMKKALDMADIYFKRSFSPEKNQVLFPEYAKKMHPLGFNYHLTHKDNPINEPWWKALIKPLTGRTPERFFVPEVFEAEPKLPQGRPKVLFLAQLWEEDEPGLPPSIVAERQYINEMRLEIMRSLRKEFGDSFIGGLVSSPLSLRRAPELVLPRQKTERRAYLSLVHDADICIGTMGLYESIGWKTAEYIAAAKAIVNERLRYQVTGDFAEGKNYLAFANGAECVQAVKALASDWDALYHMKQANREYYLNYLKPEVLVKNSLKTADEIIG